MRPVRPLYYLALAIALAAVLLTSTEAKIAYHEQFESLDDWVISTHRPDYGKVALSAGSIFVDEKKETGLQLTEDARFYALSKKLPVAIDNAGKDFVVSFSVKSEQSWKCGGAYLKFAAEMEQKNFNGDSAYWLMFGPDRCGSTNRVHIIFNYKGKNLLWKKNMAVPYDKLTHVYTLRVSPDHTYSFYLDGDEKLSGSLDEDWDFLQPKMIPDPADTKPDDWVDEPLIADPEATKPDDWDSEPAVIVDTTASKPEDWDDAEDGEWEAPEIPNPKYKGLWTPRQIPNPAYIGPWIQKEMANPDYKEDADLYKVPEPLQYVGIDVWQVEAGSIFNNIIISDDVAEVMALVKSTYGEMAAAEKEAQNANDDKKAADTTPEAELTGAADTPIEDEEHDL